MRKNIFFLMLLVSFAACQTDGTGTNAAASVVVTEPAAAAEKPKIEVVHVPASVLAPMVGLWHYQTVVGIKDAKTKDDYFGRWIELKSDQTFTSGIWQDQTNSGKWTFEAESNLINFYYEKPEVIFDEFQVQGTGQDIVVFKGNTKRTNRGIQIKMVKDSQRPAQ